MAWSEGGKDSEDLFDGYNALLDEVHPKLSKGSEFLRLAREREQVGVANVQARLPFGSANRPTNLRVRDPLPPFGASLSEAILYGYFGGAVNVTDGRHTYHRYPPDLRTQE